MAERRKRHLHELTLDTFWSRKKKKETEEDSEDSVEGVSDSIGNSSSSSCDADISQSGSSAGQSESSIVYRTELPQAPQGKALYTI